MTFIRIFDIIKSEREERVMKDIMKDFRLQVWYGILTGKIYLNQGRRLINLMKELNLDDNKKEFIFNTLTELMKN